MALTYNNHFVPQLYLRHFASDDGIVARYRLLVSRESVPLWKQSHVAGTGYERHLYTRIVNGQERDEFETWLSEEFENPAVAPLRRAVNDERLSKKDYRLLSRFFAAQAVRTPAFLIRNRPRWVEEAQKEMDESPERLVKDFLGRGMVDGALGGATSKAREYFPMRVTEVQSANPATRRFRTEVVVGRAFWLFAMRHTLTGIVDRLEEHRWTILEAPKGIPWFTSDDPAIQLNYHADDKYDFGAGWGSRGSELILPLSPKHLLYTHIENKPPQRGTSVEPARTVFLRRMIAEHAHRIIYARTPEVAIESLRKRRIDEGAVRHERDEWKRWHVEQSQAENDLQATT